MPILNIIYCNIAFCTLLVLKNNEEIYFDSMIYKSFNYTAIRILRMIIQDRSAFEYNHTYFEKKIHESLLSITEPYNNSIDGRENLKIHLNMKKSLFLKILDTFDMNFKSNEIMEILHSKIYLFSRSSKKLTKIIFLMFFNKQISKESIFQEYEISLHNIDHKSSINSVSQHLILNLDLQSKVYADFQTLKNDNISSSKDDKAATLQIRDRDVMSFIFSNSENFTQGDKNAKEKFQTPNISRNEHPFNQYLKYFCDLVYITFNFSFTDLNEIHVLAISSHPELKVKNTIPISIHGFFENSILFDELTRSQNRRKCILSFDSHPNLVIFSFLEHFKQQWYQPYIRLQYNINNVLTIIDKFIALTNPKSITLDSTRFYPILYCSRVENKKRVIFQKFTNLMDIILSKIYSLKLQIDTFCIEIKRSRIFNFTDIRKISDATFCPSLHTSICLKNEIKHELFHQIVQLHCNAYQPKKNVVLDLLHYTNQFIYLLFASGEMRINDIFIKKYEIDDNINHVNAIIEDNDCTIEIDKSSPCTQSQNVLNTKHSSEEQKMDSSSHTVENYTQAECKNEKIAESNKTSKTYTSFDIFLYNFLRIKSRSTNSFLLLTSAPRNKLEINNCLIHFLLQPPSDIIIIIIKNSIINNLYSLDLIKCNSYSLKNTNIYLRNTHINQNYFTGVFYEIKIKNCSPVLRIYAQFKKIEIVGHLQDYTICNQFEFHFKSEKYAKFSYCKEDKYLEATNIIFKNDNFLTFTVKRNLINCEIIYQKNTK